MGKIFAPFSYEKISIFIWAAPFFNRTWNDFLINKEAFLKTVEENIDLFRQILGPNIEGGILLKKISNGRHPLEVIQNDEALLGILLGFGRKSALFYKRADYLSQFIDENSIRIEERLPPQWTKLSAGFMTIQEEVNALRKQFWFPAKFHPLDFVNPVAFAAHKEDPETIPLLKKYHLLKKKLSFIYSHGNILEITLEKLCE